MINKIIHCQECGCDLVVPVSGALMVELGHSRVFGVEGRTLCADCYAPVAEQRRAYHAEQQRKRAFAFYQEHIWRRVPDAYKTEVDYCKDIILDAIVELLKEIEE